MDTIGDRIKQLRDEAGLSQMQLSEKIGLSQSAIARYELNKTEPKASDIIKLSEFFGVSADYLLGISDV